MKLKRLWKRWLAATTSVLVLAPSLIMPFEGMAEAAVSAYDNTYMVARFSELEKTYKAPDGNEKNLYTDWQFADGASADKGIDVSGHDLTKLELRMTMTLTSSDPYVDVNKAFNGGFIKLRSFDTGEEKQENNVGFSVRPLKLQLGANYISVNLAEWYQNNTISTTGQIDLKTINRMNIYIDSIPKDQGIDFTMTLADICLVDTTRETAPRVAAPSEGMQSMDKIVYSVNAVELGADKTGERDSTSAIQNAIQKVTNGGVVFLPAGRYKVNGTLRIPAGVTLRGEWLNPEQGGLGKGTILMAYAGRGNDNPTDGAFISISSGACLRDISVWYPEQEAADPAPYPATIYGNGHTDVINVTLYNSYYGFYNNSCSSMLIRQLYGTVLYRGIHGAYAYDIPRIENVYFDTKYWAESGLNGAPSGEALSALNTYAESNLVAIQAGEQDWGYWYDLNINHAKYGILLTAVLNDENKKKIVPGNIAAGKVTTRHTKIGVYMENVGYPGFQLTYSDLETSEYGMYYAPRPDYSDLEDQYEFETNGIKYYDNATIVVSATSFKGGKASFYSDKSGGYGVNFNDCTFADWSQAAIRLNDGSLTVSNSQFNTNKIPLSFTQNVKQAVLVGNRFASAQVVTGGSFSDNDSRIRRDDADTSIPHTPDYDYTFVSDVKPAGDAIFNVMDYGAVAGDTRRIPSDDSTGAFQQALDAAGEAGGGTVYIPAGAYRINGALSVPTGVELRGSFESAHYGNSTYRGTQLCAYGYKDNENGAPLITLAEGAGIKGFTVFYPEQGYSDLADIDAEKVHAYPPTVRANKNTWIQNMAMIATYTAIDAMTNKCDNIVITDVTGAAMYATLIMGHGTDGGYVQNLHFNYSGWTQQGRYSNRPQGDDRDISTTSGKMADYTTRITKGLILGDVKNVNFFSCFNIIVAEQIVLKADPYTGGSFDGTMWGVAFDAATNGVIGEAGSNAQLTIVSSMGVFNRQGGGYNIRTQPGFTGRVSLFNADAWDAESKLVYIEGGTVDLVQFFSWCVYNGVCRSGGVLNVYGSTIISNNGDNNGRVPDFTYESGAAGEVVGNLDCRQMLNVVAEEGSYVTRKLNGAGVSDFSPEPVDKNMLKTLLDGRRTGAGLVGYTEESVQKYNALFDAAWIVYNNEQASAVEIFAQIRALRTADDILKRELVPGQLAMTEGTLTSPVDHYMKVVGTFNTPINLTKYDKNDLKISMDIRVNMDEASFPELLKDVAPEEWIKYIVNGTLILWGNDTKAVLSDEGAAYLLKCGQGQLKDAVVGEYITVTFPVPEKIIQDGQITKFEFYLYNDLHDLLNKLDPADPPKYSNYGEGVSISMKEMTLLYHAEVEAEKTALRAAIAEAETVNTAEYTPDSVKTFNEALANARKLVVDATALQSEVNAATTALTQAQTNLLKKANKSALNAAIAAAEAVTDTSIYTDVTVKAFTDALEAAQRVAADENATQAQVDAAAATLTDAQNGLIRKPAVKEALKAAIAEAKEKMNDGKIYSPETMGVLVAKLAEAEVLAEQSDAIQAQVDAAVTALNTATAGLRYLAGDVDGNGEVTAADALLALQAATGKITLSGLQFYAADVDGKENITAADALLVLQRATNKISSLA